MFFEIHKEFLLGTLDLGDWNAGFETDGGGKIFCSDFWRLVDVFVAFLELDNFLFDLGLTSLVHGGLFVLFFFGGYVDFLV